MREGDYREAIQQYLTAEESHRATAEHPEPRSLRLALLYRIIGEEGLARVYFDSARVVLESAIEATPEWLYLRSDLGIAYAGLGRADDARRLGEFAIQESENDHFWGPSYARDMACILTLLGEYDEALDLLDHLLAIPAGAWASAARLRDEPEWTPLYDLPRFQALLERYAEDEGR
jgi:tetratricopeptide (TPR) repeat protein